MNPIAQAHHVIRGLTDDELRIADPLPSSLRLASEGTLSVYYAPFDYVNPSARVVIVGITPGRVQAVNAIRAARDALRSGKSLEDAQRAAKRQGSFSGPLRGNLVRMLDHFAVHRWLGIDSSALLFEPGSDLAHFTSALQFPVFVNGNNYTGRSPHMLRSPFLRQQLEAHLPQQLAALPGAIFVPLGEAVAEALAHLGRQGLIDEERILPGLVHPSGANAERVAYLIGDKAPADLSAKTNAQKLDQARERAHEFMGRLRFGNARPANIVL